MAFLRAICIAAGLLFFAGFARAQVTIPAPSCVQLAGGKLNLDRADLQDGGTLGVGTGTIASANNISIATGKNYVFRVGLTQTFSALLTVLGTAVQGIQFRLGFARKFNSPFFTREFA